MHDDVPDGVWRPRDLFGFRRVSRHAASVVDSGPGWSVVVRLPQSKRRQSNGCTGSACTGLYGYGRTGGKSPLGALRVPLKADPFAH